MEKSEFSEGFKSMCRAFRILKEGGVRTLNQAQLLVEIYSKKPQDRWGDYSKLMKEIGMSYPSFSNNVVSPLESKKLVYTEKFPKGSPAKIVYLTEIGANLVERAESFANFGNPSRLSAS